MKTLPEHLLAPIKAEPENDAPRLALADWLEKQKRNTRAAVIRLQCGGGNPDSTELGRLAEKLEEEGETPGLVVFERGMARVFYATWDSSDARAIEAFVRNEPFLHVMMLGLEHIESHEDVIEGMRLVPPQIRELSLLRARGADGNFHCCPAARGLAASPKPAGVNVLLLDEVGTDGLCAGSILEAARSWELETLGFLDGRLTEHRGVAVLAGAPPAEKLRVLMLRANKLRGPDVATLLGGRAFPVLESLDLGDNPLGDAGAQVLADSGRTLRKLVLGGCGLTDDGAFLLANSTALSTLEYLSLERNAIGALGKKKLLDRFGERVEL